MTTTFPTAPIGLRLSRTAAAVIGILLPLGEGVRRWGTDAPWYSWADDFVIGGFLLLGAWAAWSRPRVGKRVLIAAWGFACGAGMMSLIGHLRDIGLPESTNLPRRPVAWVLTAGWALAWAALAASVFASEPGPAAPADRRD